MSYTGYLSPHIGTIRALHGDGKMPREIATALYAAGVETSGTMVHYVLSRFGEKPTPKPHADAQKALELRDRGMTYAGIGKKLSLSTEQARKIVIRADRRRHHLRWTDKLSTRVRSALNRFVVGRGYLFEMDEVEIAKLASTARWNRIPNFGKRSRAELCAWLASHGLEDRAVP